MSDDPLGDRMKRYESEVDRRFLPTLPVIARIDGRCFSTWTRGLIKPFDPALHRAMVETTKALVEESNATIGYTQSDEISLILYQPSWRSQIFFDGRVAKLTSVLASIATAVFNSKALGAPAQFDCRCWQVPNTEEAANAILWREQDATRNSVQSLARTKLSHKACHGKSTEELKTILRKEHGVDWDDLPDWAKRGTYVRRETVERELTEEELAPIPEEHRLEGPVKRHVLVEMDMPPLAAVWNRAAVVCEGADPVTVFRVGPWGGAENEEE